MMPSTQTYRIDEQRLARSPKGLSDRSNESINTSEISRRMFGHLPGDEEVQAWVLTGKNGLVLECISYGAIVTRILVPDRQGRLDDVVLGFNDLESYLEATAYFGGMIGRVAGRVPDAQIQLNGVLHKLTANDGSNHLHSGHLGFDKKQWYARSVDRSDGAPSLRLELTSPDGEEGYPGTVLVSVTYTVTDDNTFLIETEAVADQLTPLTIGLRHRISEASSITEWATINACSASTAV